MNKQNKTRYPLLDILRILAASMVLIYHHSGGYGRWFALKNKPLGQYMHSPESTYTHLSLAGFVGVYIFFVISGFVIPITALNSNYKKFAYSRLRRIFKPYLPILLLSLPISIALYGKNNYNDFKALLSSALLTPLQYDKPNYLIGSAWTLSHELFFYTLFLLILLLIPNTFKKFQGDAVAIFGLSWYALLLINQRISFNLNTLLDIKYAPFFITGLLLFATVNKKRVLYLIPLAFILRTDLILIITRSKEEAFYSPTTSYFALTLFLFSIPIVLASPLIKIKSGKLERKINFLGLASYPLYLIQDTIGLFIYLKLASIMAIPFALISSLTIAILLSILTERLLSTKYKKTPPKK